MSKSLKSLTTVAALLLGVAMTACGGSDPAPVVVNPGKGTGPAATLACKSTGQNAFATYGATAFVAVNEQIFTNVNAELGANGTKNLGASFNLIGTADPAATTDDGATFKGKLAAFLVYVYGGPTSVMYTDGKTYQGSQDMVVAHAGLNISSAQYDYFVTNVIVPALTAKGVSSDDVSSCFAPPLVDANFKKQIVQSAAGPASTLKCSSNGTKNAFDTYGATAFVAVNESIFANVNAEITAHGTANLGDSFTKIGSGNPASTKDAAATFKGKLAAFLVYVYGGPDNIKYTDSKIYFGPKDMVKAHLGLAITSAQYDYFVSNIVVPALTGNGVPSGDVSTCFAPPLVDAGFKASIVGH